VEILEKTRAASRQEISMGQIAEILARQEMEVQTIEPGATVYDAIRKMVQRNIGSILVAEGDSILGIFTERDYLRRIVLEKRTSKTTEIREVMTSKLVCVDPGRSVEDCLAIVTQERIRHLPVLEAGRLVGIVSIGDLVKFLSKQRAIEIRYLTDYITGKYPA
jgi:CBS domain-containing protein